MFLGTIPQELTKVTPEILSQIHLTFANLDLTGPINYLGLIQDIGEIFSTGRKKSSKSMSVLTDRQLNHLKFVCRVTIRSAYEEIISKEEHGDWERMMKQKLVLGSFIINFLKTVKDVYGIEIMHDQTDFINRVETMNKAFILIPGIVNSIPEEDFYFYQVSDIWPVAYGEEKLASLSKKLCECAYTEGKEDFHQGFMKRTRKACNWKKSKTLFLFLLGLIYKDNNLFPNPLLKFCAGRFTFDGKTTTTANLQTQLSQLGDTYFKCTKDLLPEKYLEVYNLYAQVFQS